MEHFKNDDEGYTRWTIDHYGRGFVLHRAGPGEFTIHVAGCGHIYDDAPDYKLTGNEKVCDESEAELRGYVRQEGGRRPVTCESCGT